MFWLNKQVLDGFCRRKFNVHHNRNFELPFSTVGYGERDMFCYNKTNVSTFTTNTLKVQITIKNPFSLLNRHSILPLHYLILFYIYTLTVLNPLIIFSLPCSFPLKCLWELYVSLITSELTTLFTSYKFI